MMDEGRWMRPDGIRRNHQEEPASDAGERKKEKSGGAVRLRRLVCQGGSSSIQRISCPGMSILPLFIFKFYVVIILLE
jgi:hypothetical protein